MNSEPEMMALLTARLDALERRVAVLEHDRIQGSEAAAVNTGSIQPSTLANAVAKQNQLVSGSSFLLFAGKSLLGIAGAYLLRAVAESAVVPRWLAGLVAAIYAAAWFMAGVRSAPKPRLAPSFYSLTSILILIPMLWEMTLHFHAFSPAAALSILSGFGALVFTAAWKQELSAAFSIGTAGIACTALALSVATHAMLPFTALLLVLLALFEYRYLRRFKSAARPLVAVLADVAVWTLLAIYRMPENARFEYALLPSAAILALPTLLLVIGLVSLAVRVGIRQERISAFEIAQNMAGLALVFTGAYWLYWSSAPTSIGILCLLLAIPCYWLGFGRFRQATDARNFHVFAVWSASLFLAGLFLLASLAWSSTILALTGLAAVWIAMQIRCELLELHGVAFLTIAAITSGLLGYASEALAGIPPTHLAWSVAITAVCILVSYVTDDEKPEEQWDRQVLHFVPALLSACALMGFLVHSIAVILAAALTPAAYHIALVRTMVICTVALILAFWGARLRRLEMTRLAYLATVFVVAKLIFEDLRHGHLAFTAASIALVALTLIAVPRLGRQLKQA